MRSNAPSNSADDGLGPERILLQAEHEELCRELVRKASAFVKDPRHLEAVVLRYMEGWPMTEKDTTKPDLVRHFKKSARQIQNWINTALKQMRETSSSSAQPQERKT